MVARGRGIAVMAGNTTDPEVGEDRDLDPRVRVARNRRPYWVGGDGRNNTDNAAGTPFYFGERLGDRAHDPLSRPRQEVIALTSDPLPNQLGPILMGVRM